jgi:DNA-binding IscR family transcriptional regulator
MLAGVPESIRLLDIVSAIDGLDLFDKCVLGFTECSSEHPCPVHDTWKSVRSTMRDMLSQENLADLMPVTKTKIRHTVRSVKRKSQASNT